MPFLQDFLDFNEGNECPRNYLIWSGLCMLSAITGRRTYFDFDHFRHFPNLYVCLVGEQGDGKSTAKNQARKMLMESFPSIPVFSAKASNEAICMYLGTEDASRPYKDETGKVRDCRPLVLFINELKNFLSFNPTGMLDMLCDIYDCADEYKVITKNKGVDIVPFPYVVLLACETPDWIRSRMKDKIITGGLSRRMVYVHEPTSEKVVPRPFRTDESVMAGKRCIETLRRVEQIAGPFSWTPSAIAWWDPWYLRSRRELLTTCFDPMVRGFKRTKHVQVLKVAMLLTLADGGNGLKMAPEALEQALAIIEVIEPQMIRLSEGIGQNIMAAPTQRILEIIQGAGGIMLEKQLQQVMYRDLDAQQLYAAVQHLRNTEQIVQVKEENAKGVLRVFWCLPHRAAELKKRAEERIKQNDQHTER